MRRLLASMAVAVSYLVASLFARVLSNPDHPGVPGWRSVLLALAAGLLGALTLGPLSRRLALPTVTRVAVLALLAYTLATVSNAIEAMLFIRDASPIILLTGAVLAVGLAVPVGLLWPPPEVLEDTLVIRPRWSWAWRIPLLTLAWVPIYFAFAAADAPFVQIYYHRTGTTFVVPSDGLVALAELGRGLLHTLVLGALAALLARDRRATWYWSALAFATLNGWMPLIQRSDWPPFLRAANAVEIACDAAAFAGLVALLLTRRSVRDHREDAGFLDPAPSPPAQHP